MIYTSFHPTLLIPEQYSVELYADCDIRLKKVRETGQDVLRLIIPDKYNRFPESPACMAPYKYQELNMFEE